MRALAEARRQGALAWELRTAMTLAKLRDKQGRAEEGRETVSAVHARFTEGFETRDLKAAAQLLQSEADTRQRGANSAGHVPSSAHGLPLH
jgi:predicted ATPase